MNNSKVYAVEVGDKTFMIETGAMAMQAGGAVTVRLGDSVVLCTATASKKPREGIDFFRTPFILFLIIGFRVERVVCFVLKIRTVFPVFFCRL